VVIFVFLVFWGGIVFADNECSWTVEASEWMEKEKKRRSEREFADGGKASYVPLSREDRGSSTVSRNGWLDGWME
jgi:hypothetical protein